MKTLKKSILLLTSLVMAMSLASCVNDGLTEGPAAGAGKVAALDEQAASIEATVEDLNALQSAAEGNETALDEAVNALETHIADLRSGASLMEGTMATFAMQKKIAGVIGAIEVSDEEGTLKKQISNLEKGISAWVGKNFDAYYPAAKAEAVAAARLAGLNLKTQKIRVEAILSDVEAGLRKIADKDELTGLAAAVNGNMESAEELVASLSATAAEVEAEYAQAVETAVTDPEKFDLPALKQFNSAVVSTLSEADNTLAGLIARVEACEVQLADIKARLGDLEDTIGSFEELLDMIQSVSFFSDNSSDYAVAYYELDPDNRTDDGCMKRTPRGTIELSYLIRPASAAAALTQQSLWNDGLKVFGYYAQAITKAGVETFDLNVQTVIEDENIPGLVTVTVDNAFDSEDFYFKKTGAKVALSLATGKTDITSKFVEIIPQDKSNTVYAESLTITESIELAKCESTVIKAVLNPAGADQTLTWKSSDTDVATISDEGLLVAKGIGTAVITVTSNTTDEWGRNLVATCNVTVNPDIRIVGSNYVEKDNSISLKLECSRTINPALITWNSSNPDAISVEKTTVDGINSAVVTGNAVAYSNGRYEDVTITCVIAGETTLTHTVQCVEVQPTFIALSDIDDNVKEITLKFGQSKTFNASVLPDNVDDSKFTLSYGVSGALTLSGNTVTAQDESTLKDGKTTGTFTVSVNSDYYWYDRAIQQSAEKLTRKMTVNVEPYYVTALYMPTSYNMTLDAVSVIPDVILVSDDEEHEPSYTDLVWSSSAPDYVSVDANTGQLTALQLTYSAVTITVTMKDPEKSVKPGSTVSAKCFVTVAEAAADAPKIGDYYYSDGTWGSDVTRDGIIGVVFSLIDNVPNYNTGLDETFVHGLVVGLNEYNTYPGTYSYGGPPSVMSYPFETTLPVGYINTYQLSEYGKNNGTGYAVLYRNDEYGGVSALRESTPESASPWYIPSFYEMTLISAQLDDVNTSLTNAGGSTIAGEYWTSTFKQYQYSKPEIEIDGHNLFNISNGNWGTQVASTASSGTSKPVRVVLAF